MRAVQTPVPDASGVLSVLRSRREPLFALLDCARSVDIAPLIRNSTERCGCLYSGQAAEQLADYAPYLVELAKTSSLLQELVERGWHSSWGYFLLSGVGFEVLRTHLRKFLFVDLASGPQVYFRFYDPRVLRVFLAVSTPEQTRLFFEHIDAVMCPDADPRHLLAITSVSSGTLMRRVSV